MRVTILNSDSRHPVNEAIHTWALSCAIADVEIVRHCSDALGGDFLFLVSCTEIVKAPVRNRYKHTLVLHASDLPKGRGWSPHVWTILLGEPNITVTLLEASDKVDRGDIWSQLTISLKGDELYDEINALCFAAEIQLMEYAIRNFPSITPRSQPETGASYFRRRTPEDSRIDPDKTIAEQFDLLRVCDGERFPAFFDHRGARYEIRLLKTADAQK